MVFMILNAVKQFLIISIECFSFFYLIMESAKIVTALFTNNSYNDYKKSQKKQGNKI
jgi:hypothetical protein